MSEKLVDYMMVLDNLPIIQSTECISFVIELHLFLIFPLFVAWLAHEEKIKVLVFQLSLDPWHISCFPHGRVPMCVSEQNPIFVILPPPHLPHLSIFLAYQTQGDPGPGYTNTMQPFLLVPYINVQFLISFLTTS